LVTKHLEAREVNPCFLSLCPAKSRKGFIREDSERVGCHGNGWTEPDVISFVIGWPAFGDAQSDWLTAKKTEIASSTEAV